MINKQNIFYFNPSNNNKNNIRNSTIYHYTSPFGLMQILKTPCLRFTDCQFLNDSTEYNYIHTPLKKIINKLEGKLNNCDIIEDIKRYIPENNSYNDERIIIKTPGIGIKGLQMFNMRYFVFCTSVENNDLNMWRYYVKNNNYQGYNIGICIDGFLKDLEKILSAEVKVYHGPVIYKREDEENILKKAILTTDKKLTLLQKELEWDDYNVEKEEIIGQLLEDIHCSRLFFKNTSFKGEKEYRFVLRVPWSITENDNETISVDYDVKNGILTPHCDIPFNKTSVIKEINLSPTLEKERGIEGLKRYLNCKGFDINKIKIDNSDIPIQ